MTPRKKVYSGSTERQQASRQRRQQAGQRQIAIWLSVGAIEKLDRLAERAGTRRGELIEQLIRKCR